MSIIKKLQLIERVDALIQRKATGNPHQLSQKLDLSERQVYNLINTMKDMGAPILYCTYIKSYYYEKQVKFSFGFGDRLMIKGGKAVISQNIFLLQKYFSISHHI